MLISFDPRDADQRANATAIMALFAPVVEAPAPTADTAPEAPVANGADTADTAPVTPTVDPQAGVELDANGTPWLAECHATTKTQTKGGVWKGKRGMDKAEIAAMEQAARDKVAGTPEPVQPTAPVVPVNEMPQATCSVEEVSSLWQTAIETGVIQMDQYQAIYDHLQIDGNQLGVNETMRVKLRDYLNALMNPAPAAAATGLPGMPG